MRTLNVIAAVAASLALVACAAPADDEQSSPPSAASQSPSASPSPSAVPSDEPSAEEGTPQACSDYDGAPAANAEGGDAIAAAAATATLPHDAVLVPGVQVVTSTDEPGMLEAVARFCTYELDEAQVIDVANEIAMAIRATPAGDTLSALVVSSWTPDAQGVLQQGETVSTRTYQMFTWDPTAAVPMSNNWD